MLTFMIGIHSNFVLNVQYTRIFVKSKLFPLLSVKSVCNCQNFKCTKIIVIFLLHYLNTKYESDDYTGITTVIICIAKSVMVETTAEVNFSRRVRGH